MDYPQSPRQFGGGNEPYVVRDRAGEITTSRAPTKGNISCVRRMCMRQTPLWQPGLFHRPGGNAVGPIEAVAHTGADTLQRAPARSRMGSTPVCSWGMLSHATFLLLHLVLLQLACCVASTWTCLTRSMH